MTYEEELVNYYSKIEYYLNSPSRRSQEYGNYLKAWFDDDIIVDGARYSDKVKWKVLPMSFIVYSFG